MSAVTNSVAAIVILSFFPIAVLTLHLFAIRNGTIERFLKLIDDNKLPSGRSFQPWTTKGRFPKADWQIKAFGIFISIFSDNLSHPATSLHGFLYAGTWGPSWYMVVMEAFRSINRGHWLSYLALPGYLMFHHSNGLFMPLYLALTLFFLPSCQPQNQIYEALLIPRKHLQAMPVSFLLGFALPVTLLCAPTPRTFTRTTKDTITAWYQQWHIYVEAIHYTVIVLSSASEWMSSSGDHTSQGSFGTQPLFEINYSLAVMLAAVPYLLVTVISVTSCLAPAIFNPKLLHTLHPKNFLLPTWPRRGLKATDIQQGLKWLIQWDFILNTAAFLLWAVALRFNVRQSENLSSHSLGISIFRSLIFLILGGPNALAVGLIWDREMVISNSLAKT